MFFARALIACFLAVPVVAVLADDSEQASIVGKWEVVKSPEAPVGSSVEFTKDGKLILIPKGKQSDKLEATYKVEGKKLITYRKEEKNVLTIQTLNATTFVAVNEKGQTDEMKRKK